MCFFAFSISLYIAVLFNIMYIPFFIRQQDLNQHLVSELRAREDRRKPPPPAGLSVGGGQA
ncbi:hypothetical protein HanRHA438_Chr01g0028721 [Helianthus annuus]|nr:hypothetical protein HanRHA438_Chr01g0028721 [Helianthus annuus]